MRYLFSGGKVVSGSGVEKADVLVEDEKIVAVGPSLAAADAARIDVSNKFLFPGFIDAHTHMDLDVSDTVTIDGFDTGTKAELAGGTTCIVDFATQNKGETLAFALRHWHEKADCKASCDFAFHLALSDWNEQVSRELDEVVAQGIRSFKLYTTYDAMVLDDKSIYEVFARLKELGAIAGVHCENKGVIDARLEALLKRKGSRADVADYPATRPAYAEAEAVNRILYIARCVGTPVVIVHLSSKEGLAEVVRAKEVGQDFYVETCPQYLLLDESRYRLEAAEARKYMIAPPLRTAADQEALWKALADDVLYTVCTDHCSFSTAQKNAGADDFAKTPCGMSGAEERPALMYNFGVREGRISIEQMCAYLSEHPAKLYGLYPKKGILAAGSDADIVVWDPAQKWRMTAACQQSASDYCPMEGTEVFGRAHQVWLRGVLAARDGEILQPYLGRYQPAFS